MLPLKRTQTHAVYWTRMYKTFDFSTDLFTSIFNQEIIESSNHTFGLRTSFMLLMIHKSLLIFTLIQSKNPIHLQESFYKSMCLIKRRGKIAHISSIKW